MSNVYRKLKQDPSISDIDALRYALLADFRFFCKYFFKELRGADLVFPKVKNNHIDTIIDALVSVYKQETRFLLINVWPGSGKSTLIALFIAWTYGKNPACNNIYASYGADLATERTALVRDIITSQAYQSLFPWVSIRKDTDAKGNYSTTAGGKTVAAGVGGAIMGRDAGLPYTDKYTGAFFMDDPIKFADGVSDTIRVATNEWYYTTVLTRLRGLNTPVVIIMQRVHLEDISAIALESKDGNDWRCVVIPVEDDNGNSKSPELLPNSELKKLKLHNYKYAAQYLQNPIAAGHTLIDVNAIHRIQKHPNYLTTFITVDTAESVKDYSDYTVFSFFGVSKLRIGSQDIDGQYGLTLINCLHKRLLPEDIYNEFIEFLGNAMGYTKPVSQVFIEKKSSGTSLLDRVKNISNVVIQPIERESKISKMQRFVDASQYINKGNLSLLANCYFEQTVINELKTITANNAHAHDDIMDTIADAVDLLYVKNKIIIQDVDLSRYHLARKIRKIR